LLLGHYGVKDPANIIKQYNAKASAGGMIQGGKRVAILALLNAPRKALAVLAHTVSSLGDTAPWLEEAWGNKKIMPGGGVKVHGSVVWTKRLVVTPESFTLMVSWQSNQQSKKLVQLRRKFDKSAMEDAAAVSSLVLALKTECMEQHPVPEDDLDEHFVRVFLRDLDLNLLLFLQSLIHAKPEAIDLEEVPVLGDRIQIHVRKADVATTGLPKTELLNAEIEKTEFQLFVQKMDSDLGAVAVFARTVRIGSVSSVLSNPNSV
jgi:hypothetical protein